MAGNKQEITEKVTADDIMHLHEAMVVGALIEQAKRLNGKYTKQVLTRLEADGILTPGVRKHTLDGFNDMRRELEELLQQITL